MDIAESLGIHHIERMRAALFLAISVFGLVMANTAMAGKNDAEWNPPARFDHAYPGKLTVHYLPQKQIVEICAKLVGKRSMIQHGCSSFPKDGKCEAWIVDKTYMGATPESVLRHEVGHCNGWGSDHPN